MSVTITLHIFSGRPDPSWELSDDQAKELAQRIGQIQKTTLLKPAGFAGTVGYRGFSAIAVREKALDPHVYIHGGVVDLDRFDLNRIADSPDLEEWLLSTAGSAVSDEVRKFVQAELSGGTIRPLDAAVSILTVPPYDPGKWNNDAAIRTRNNCYNYANDKITNSFAQPGLGSGERYSALTCASVGGAAQRDGQVPVGPPVSTPADGHYIALVIWPGQDFHWYRQDNNTRWSHKPGQSPVRNVDSSGNIIVDPQSCDRGPYSQFCGYYHSIPANTRIQ
ncbi:MAG: hypothetical protein ACJ8LG_09025 [Massilia sp.]